MKYFYFNGRAYRLDLKRMNAYVFASQKERNSETEVVEVYGTDPDSSTGLAVTNKSVRDLKSNGNAQMDSFKYDFLRMMYDVMCDTAAMGEEDNGEYSVGFAIAVNTFISEGFLVPVDDDED